MVLIRILGALAALLAAAGCGESLFDAHGGRPDGGGGDASVPELCPPATCLADAAADFDGTVRGAGDRWRYLDDRRDRTWASMAPVAGGMDGAAGNRIRRCAGEPPAAACQELRGALLVTSSGASPDPALAYESPGARVIQLALRAHVTGAPQRVRLYRNSREDVLFTASAAPGDTVAHTITVDALAGDRFLIALEPAGPAGGTAALHFFVIDARRSFPSTCQLAVPFSVPGSTDDHVDDLCRGELASLLSMMPAPPLFRDGPFAEQGMAAHFEPGIHYEASEPLDRSGGTTVQFWVHNDAPSREEAWVFSDLDPLGGGLGIRFRNASGDPADLRLEASVAEGLEYVGPSIGYDPTAGTWRFVRVVHAGGAITLCLDGARALPSAPVAGPLASSQAPHLGRNGVTDAFPNLEAALDDVRVFSGALPCDDP